MITQRDINKRQKDFRQIGINEKETPPKIIQFSKSSASAQNSNALRAVIIEAPSDANYDADPESEEYVGRSWYTCRLVGTTLTVWEALDPEAEEPPEVFPQGTIRVYPTVNSPSYIALVEISGADVAIAPPSLPEKWEKQENKNRMGRRF